MAQNWQCTAQNATELLCATGQKTQKRGVHAAVLMALRRMANQNCISIHPQPRKWRNALTNTGEKNAVNQHVNHAHYNQNPVNRRCRTGRTGAW